MSASPFAFYRGSAAVQADLARNPSTPLHVASCGDAHVANFGFYASPQRTLVFDLNDFDEAAWAPWEWDLKRLVTSVVLAGAETDRDLAVVRDAAASTVRAYVRAMASRVEQDPVDRYFEHFGPREVIDSFDRASRIVLERAMAEPNVARCARGSTADRRHRFRPARLHPQTPDHDPRSTRRSPRRVLACRRPYRTSANVGRSPDPGAVRPQRRRPARRRRRAASGPAATCCSCKTGTGTPLLLQGSRPARACCSSSAVSASRVARLPRHGRRRGRARRLAAARAAGSLGHLPRPRARPRRRLLRAAVPRHEGGHRDRPS